MGAATFILTKRLIRTQIFRYTYPSIAATGSAADIALEVPRRAFLAGISISCPTSVDFDVLLAQNKGVSFPDNDIVVYAIDQNQQYKEVFPKAILYFNNETVEASELFLTIVNTDGIHATGTIAIDLMIEFQEEN